MPCGCCSQATQIKILQRLRFAPVLKLVLCWQKCHLIAEGHASHEYSALSALRSLPHHSAEPLVCFTAALRAR